MHIVATLLATVTIAFSLVAFMAMWLDKRRAVKGKLRIRERTLHTFSLLGGWLGTWLAMRVVRHKTIDLKFRILLILISALHIAAWAWMAWLAISD